MEEVRSTTIYVAVTFFAAVLVLACIALFQYRPIVMSTTADRGAPAAQSPAFGDGAAVANSETKGLASRRIRRLQELLRKQQDELRMLKAKYEPGPELAPRERPSLGALVPKISIPGTGLLDREDTPDAGGSVTADAGTDPPAERADAEAALENPEQTLRDQLEVAETLLLLQAEELSEMRTELERIRQESNATEELRAEFDERAAELLREYRELQTEASLALMRMGPEAELALTPLLDDDRSFVRQWVADLLGAIAQREDDGETEPEIAEASDR